MKAIGLNKKALIPGALLIGALALFPARAEPTPQCSRNADEIKSAMVIQKENGEFCAVDEAERKKQQDALAAALAPPSPSIAAVSKVAAAKTAKPDLVWQSAPRELGLQQLVNAGAIRAATEQDHVAWLAAASAAGNHAAKGPSASLLFVVLKPIVAPADMYGGHSRDFIVPHGVPMPIDNGSHNTYYFIASGTCMGAASGCSR
jgi:hypothetical protein